MTKPILIAMAALVLAGLVQPAAAQLGTSNNPPPQRLFDTGPPQQRLDTGLGTMAERRARIAQLKRSQRPIRR